MKLILAGASGLVGGHVLTQAEALGYEVTTIGRRSLNRGAREVVTDFSAPVSLSDADAAICALGTTMAAAGSRRAFYAVDHDAVLSFAESAQQAGAPHFLLVSAVGAKPRAAVYYSRVKGETERDLEALGFARLDIAQPGLLIGARDENRPVERLLQATDSMSRLALRGPWQRYAGIRAEVVAKALLKLCAQGSEPEGVFRHENSALEDLTA